ncbi:hypothetical protein E4T56_gene17884 [Termitomyces sp. T112]|nr:hypothetical protein E4T56_gene17884 [Termitomyces sp. T112]
MVIPETVLPEGWDAPLQNPIPRVVPPLPAPIQRRGNRVNQSALAQAAMVIPETVLPEGWDAPLQNPLPRMVPPLPAPVHRRVRNGPLPELIMAPAPLALQALLEEQQRLRQRQQEQALAILQEQQRLRHIAMATEQERQQQEVLAVLQEQQRLRQDQERQQALAILSQERLREEEEEHIDLNPEHRPLNAVMAQRIFQGWEQQHEADLEEDFNDLGPQNDIPSEDDLEYVDPVQQRPAEQLDPPLDVPLGPQDDIPSDDDLEYVDPVQQRPAEQLDPPLDVLMSPSYP